MEKVIIYELNGNVAVCTPTGELDVETVLAKDCPAGAIIVDKNSLPNDDIDFFNAWELVNNQVIVNKVKAAEITKIRLRTEREPLLVAQDVLFQRAMESNADTSKIVAEKQRLRDITKLADIASSLNELRSLKAII
jgi:hypothetical protein